MRPTAIIQARMGSTRLPGKALVDIEGRPMLWHVVNRLRYCKTLQNIVVATTSNKNDDVIEGFCQKYHINIYRGSEDDVLDRYYCAAKFYKANPVVRITSDCPLIDPQVVDKIISQYLENSNKFDGACNTINRTYPRGLDTEVLSFHALEECWKRAKKDYQREHVTIYIYEHSKQFKIQNIENSKDFSHFRWTVDEEADLKFIREVYKKLQQEGKIFLMDDVVKILKKEPQLLNINEHVKQKDPFNCRS